MSQVEEEAERIVDKIKGSLRPLECKADIWDYNAKIKFRVLHEGKKVYERKRVSIQDLISSPDGFATYVNTVRHFVCKKIKETKPNFEFIDPDLEA